MDIRQRFAARVRYFRRERGWTQEQLAHSASLTAKYIGQIERAEVSPSLSVLERIARAFTITLAVLLDLPDPDVASRERVHDQLSRDEVRRLQDALGILQRLFAQPARAGDEQPTAEPEPEPPRFQVASGQ